MKVPEPTPLRDPDQGAVDELLGLLDLETIDQDLYRGGNVHTPRGRVFGGQVAAQSLIAGARTVETEARGEARTGAGASSVAAEVVDAGRARGGAIAGQVSAHE